MRIQFRNSWVQEGLISVKDERRDLVNIPKIVAGHAREGLSPPSPSRGISYKLFSSMFFVSCWAYAVVCPEEFYLLKALGFSLFPWFFFSLIP